MTLILGIETSCDETAAAVVEDGRVVRSNVVGTQHDEHAPYRGVVPEIASRAHVELIHPILERAVQQAGLTFDDLDAVAVGNRPGLIGSLIVGLSAAKALSLALNIPLIGVDHVRAHLHAWQLDDANSDVPAPTPAAPHLGLVVSGGHTSLYRIDRPDELHVLGRTIDDAVGEAFDKAAALMNLGYPGGPTLDKLAESGDPKAFALPRSLLAKDSLDFSYSGLKTALLYTVRGQPTKKGDQTVFPRSASDLSPQQQQDLAASFRAAAIEPLRKKLHRALDQLQNANAPACAVIVGGGVSANRLLRRELEQLAIDRRLPVHVPPLAYCLDNAAMIAGHAHARLAAGHTDDLSLPAIASSTM